MTQEERKSLVIDLCQRLPYGVKIDREWIAPMSGCPSHCIDKLSEFDTQILRNWCENENAGLTTIGDKVRWVRDYSCKPYLRSMSSMTEEEEKEYKKLCRTQTVTLPLEMYTRWYDTWESIDWLNAHHFDYRGLIEKGLAIEITEENNPY